MCLALAPDAMAQIVLSSATKEVGAGLSKYPIVVNAGGVWSAVSHATWASISPATGLGQIPATITVQRNDTGATREATITIGNATHVIVQLPADSEQKDVFGLGSNYSGQLGFDTVLLHTLPASTLTGVTALPAHMDSHHLFIKTDGSLWALGNNSSGQLGDGSSTNRLTPILVTTDCVATAVGQNHSLFLKSDGTLWGMGANSQGQLGDGSLISRSTPILIATGVARIAADFNQSFFIKTDGTLWAMGYNNYGQLGNGTTTNLNVPNLIATDTTEIAAGSLHTVFIKTDGTLWAMGYNNFGQLGDGTTSNRTAPKMITTGVVRVAAGQNHTLLVKADGTLWAMGFNVQGALGTGTAGNRTVPVQIATGVSQIAASHSSLFIKQDGTLWAMGYNASGQLGIGHTTSQTIPVQVADNAIAASASPSSSAFLKSDGTLWVMGASYLSRLGEDTSTGKSEPAFIATATATAAASKLSSQGSASFGNHSLMVKADGSLWAAGDNTSGQLGDGTTQSRPTPVQIVAQGVVAASAGSMHSLFLKNDGTLWAMGSNSAGQLGDGTTTARSQPVQIAAQVAACATGLSHSLFLKTDGTLWAMGYNANGQLGDGSTTNRNMPVQIASDVAAMAAGGNISAFIKTDFTFWAVGSMDYIGKVGNNLPIQLATNAAAISVGSAHLLFIKRDRTLWGMGSTLYGKLGPYVSSLPASSPVQITTDVVAASAGADYSMHLKSDGSLWATGRNDSSQLGDGTTIDRSTPVRIASGIAAMVAGGSHTLVLAGSAARFSTQPKATPSLLWNQPSSLTYGQALGAATLSAAVNSAQLFSYVPATGTVPNSGLAVDFTMPGAFTYTPATGTLLNAGTHTLSVTFTPADSINYNSVTLERTLTVNKAPAPLALGNLTTVYNGSPQSATATTEPAELNVTFTYDGSSTPPTNVGSYAVEATVVDQNYYGSATGTLVISKATPQITWAEPSAIVYGAAVGAGELNAVADVAGTFAYDPADGIVLNAGTHTLTATFAPVDEANYTGASAQRTLTVNKAVASVTLDGLAATYDGAPKIVTVTTMPAGLAVGLTYAGSVTAPTAAGSYAVEALVNEDNYTGSTTGTLVIGKAAQTITFTGPADQSFNVAPVTLSATATSSLSVSFALLSGPATLDGDLVTLTGAGTVTLRASQPGNDNYLAAPAVDRSFVVSGNFESWLRGKFTQTELADPLVSGAAADPDADGLGNLMEYALGLEPKSVDAAGLPEAGTAANDWTYTYTRPADRNDLMYEVEISPNLTTWTTAGVVHGRVSSGANETWLASYPLASAANVFFRLKVTQL